MTKKKRGFTLIEIIIVVIIITFLAAIAIPNILRAKLNANEGAAIGNMHTLVAAMSSYHVNQSPPSYPPTLVTLNSITPSYIGPLLASGTKQGYTFTYTPEDAVPAYTYTIVAAPEVVGKTGNRSFFINESGVIRVGATASGPPVE